MDRVIEAEVELIDGLSRSVEALAQRQRELLDCIRDIRRARNLEDLGIGDSASSQAPVSVPAPFQSATVEAVAIAPISPTDQHAATATVLAAAPAVLAALGRPPAELELGRSRRVHRATKRDYDYFAQLEADIARLRDS